MWTRKERNDAPEDEKPKKSEKPQYVEKTEGDATEKKKKYVRVDNISEE